MLSTKHLPLDRAALARRYAGSRERTAAIFALVDPAAFYSRPIPLRHPFVFYEGHIPAFSLLTLNIRGLGEPSLDPALEKLFERGIDPGSAGEAQRHERADWPSREAIAAFGKECDARVLQAFESAAIDDPGVPALRGAEAAYTILEHEEMHQETLMYIVHRLDPAQKRVVRQTHRDTAQPHNDLVNVPEGIALLGAHRGDGFGWDNEFEQHECRVPAFGVQRYPVTNGAYLEFVRDGGPVPPFWIEADGELRLRGIFEELPLPKSWPIYATQQQAAAYAQWAGLRLMTEAEYHRAAFATPHGEHRDFPWGSQAPDAQRVNAGFARYDPDPVDAHPAGNSAWGIADLVGNGWEWTSTPFAPFDGFEPMASYPRYSADFFDGKHYVIKGASPVTPFPLIRRSLRNWFYADYPYMYAKFRCAAPA